MTTSRLRRRNRLNRQIQELANSVADRQLTSYSATGSQIIREIGSRTETACAGGKCERREKKGKMKGCVIPRVSKATESVDSPWSSARGREGREVREVNKNRVILPGRGREKRKEERKRACKEEKKRKERGRGTPMFKRIRMSMGAGPPAREEERRKKRGREKERERVSPKSKTRKRPWALISAAPEEAKKKSAW